ncbi:MAG: UDP-N-acetylmuramate dehydrogenase [SAR324 cluster bacterium]|uniref:UDP-N-acetylenolpyruvoylglucosamine reductase n=1 Tax=SAR324 cluster bacterium TaxID=2024889 RepID=A0A7X9FQF0_9DELT|nr:UDP-N-acetylmuramate dehydrogenase [SAR324 cluster bacterium]
MAFYSSQRFEDICERETGVLLKLDVLGAKLTSFAIGGPISYYCVVDSIEDLKSLLKYLKSRSEKLLIMGAGSNILIPDEGIRGVVARLGRAFHFCQKAGPQSFVVGAASPIMSLSRMLSDEGYSGLEFAGGIPGSAGGALTMNAGAHGSSMSDIVTGARVLSADGEVLDLTKDDFRFVYRNAGLPEGMIVLSVNIELTESNREKTKRTRQEMLKERRARQPLQFASAGSVFKNPSMEKPAGLLIEKAGLKGVRIGGAEISKLHANWIINPAKDAKAVDVLALMKLCKQRVLDMAGIELEAEIKVW